MHSSGWPLFSSYSARPSYNVLKNMVKLILEQFCMCLCLVEVAVINVTTLDWQHSKFLPVLWRSQIQTVEMSKMCQRGSTPCWYAAGAFIWNEHKARCPMNRKNISIIGSGETLYMKEAHEHLVAKIEGYAQVQWLRNCSSAESITFTNTYTHTYRYLFISICWL